MLALRLTPPAFDVGARWCALVLAVLVVSRCCRGAAAISGAGFGREEQLLAFVGLAAVALGWLGSGDWIADRAFDYRAAQQKAEFMRALHDTSVRIVQFVNERDCSSRRPRPRSGDVRRQDVCAASIASRSEMATAYEGRFGARVRTAHDVATLRGLRDRDFDAFFRHPANEFQIRIVAKKLDGFSAALAKR